MRPRKVTESIVSEDEQSADEPQRTVPGAAEDALSFRACFEHAPVGIARADADGRIISSNRALASLIGSEPPARIQDLFDDVCRDHMTDLDAVVSGKRVAVDFECPLAGPREDVFALVSVARIDTGSASGHLVLVLQDITERRRVARLLARSEERFRMVLANAPTTVSEQDRDLTYLWIYNPALVDAAGEVVGRTDADLMDAESAARVEGLKRRAIAERATVRDIVAVRMAGTERAGVYDLFVEPILDTATGEVTGIAGAATDVTITARREAELAAEKERFRTSVESMLDCLGVYTAIRDANGTVVDFRVDYVNESACEANAMSREEQIGRGLCEILPAHRTSGLFDEYVALVETGEPLRKESLFYSDAYNGRKLIRAFDIRASKLRDGFVAVWRDVTDRKRLELDLADAVAERDLLLEQQKMLLNELDHRVKNNFQLLASFLTLQAARAPEDARHYLLDAWRRLMTVAAVHDALRLTPEHVETVSLVVAMDKLIDALRSEASGHIRWEVDVADVEVGSARAVTLCMIVNEIATNALKYAFEGRPGGTVTIRAVAEGDTLHLHVGDDGVGYDIATVRAGLGTNLLRRLARQLGAQVRLESDGTGTRTTLTFRLTEDAFAAT